MMKQQLYDDMNNMIEGHHHDVGLKTFHDIMREYEVYDV